MSTIKLKGNPSGTGDILIQSPSTNTNRTISLPDGDGDIVLSSSGALPALDGSALTGVSSAEIYGFYKNSDGELIVQTTNGGADDISQSEYALFDDVLFSTSGFTFSINSDGDLLATI